MDGRVRPGHDIQEISFNQASSSRTWTLCFCASFSFDPAPGPATTISVLAETEPETLAPRLSARALASCLVIFSRVPVNTTVLPDPGEDWAGAAMSVPVSHSNNRFSAFTLCG